MILEINKLALFAGFIGLPLLAAGLALTAGFWLGAAAAAPKPGRRLAMAWVCHVLSTALLVPSVYALYAGHAVYGWFPVGGNGISMGIAVGGIIIAAAWVVALVVGFGVSGVVMPIRAELLLIRRKDVRHVPPITELVTAPSAT